MRKLYEAADRFEAQRLLDLLAEHRIRALILGDLLAGAAGDLPAIVFPAVWVLDDAHFARAEDLLAGFIRPQQDIHALDWICPRCGESVEGVFQVCWNCGTSHP